MTDSVIGIGEFWFYCDRCYLVEVSGQTCLTYVAITEVSRTQKLAFADTTTQMFMRIKNQVP